MWLIVKIAVLQANNPPAVYFLRHDPAPGYNPGFLHSGRLHYATSTGLQGKEDR